MSVKPGIGTRKMILNPTVKGYHRLLLQNWLLFPVLEGAHLWNFLGVSLSHVDIMFQAAYTNFYSSSES